MLTALITPKAKLYTGGMLSVFSILFISSLSLQFNKSIIQYIIYLGFFISIEVVKVILYADAKNALKSIQTSNTEAEDGKGKNSYPTPSYEIPMSIEEATFFQEMIKSNTFPVLKGRDTVAIQLGIPYGRAKSIVNSLQAKGVIKVKGKRLIAV